jgi:ribonuclease-3
MESAIITLQDVRKILQAYNVEMSPKNVDLYKVAFTHRSMCARREMSNETLEHLGDAVLGLATTYYLKRKYPTEDEGFLSITRAKIVNGESLARLAEAIGIGKYIVTKDGRKNKKVMEDAFEAFVGAIFEDFNTRLIKNEKMSGFGIGFQVVDKWFTCVMERNINFEVLVAENSNYKDQLTSYMRTRFGCMPKFEDRDNIFTVVHDNVVVGTWKSGGGSRKSCEAKAAHDALVYFGVLSPNILSNAASTAVGDARLRKSMSTIIPIS